MSGHVIWDWNGTLFDDLHLILESTNDLLVAAGGTAITEDWYRRNYTRDFRTFYTEIFGREVDEAEMWKIDRHWHDAYVRLVDRAELRVGSDEALQKLDDAGFSQSLLSMWRHDQLCSLVEQLGLAQHFCRIQGFTEGDLTKAVHLRRHVEQLGLDGSEKVVLIGDVSDDAYAAAGMGLPCVLLTAGYHHRDRLVETEAVLVDTLSEAAEAAIDLLAIDPVGGNA